MVEARAPTYTEARAPTYTYEPDFASRQAVVWSIFWLVAAVTVGVIVHLRLVLPDLGANLGFLSYGRLRPVFDTFVIWGWLGTAAIAAVFFIIPRLSEAQLHNEPLGAATVIFWGVALFVGEGALLVGMNQGRPLGELPLGVDAILLVMMAFVLYNAGVTVVRRRGRTLYVSGWFLLTSALLLPVIFAIGNLPVFTGITDAIVNGFYRSGLELVWLLPVGLGVAYYVVPVETGRPLHSVPMARIAFWTLLFAGGWAGQRFMVGGPTLDYQAALAVAMTAVVGIPVLSSLSNLFSTGRGRWDLIGQAFGLRWAATGLALSVVWVALVLASVIPQSGDLVGLTTWNDGVGYLAAFGVFSSFAFALIYRSYPLLVGRGWASDRLSSFHFWATLIGVGAGVALLLAGGVAQGIAQQTAARLGDSTPTDELWQWIALSQRSFQVLTAIAFGVVAVAQYAFAWNAFRTVRQGPLVQLTAGPVPVRSTA